MKKQHILILLLTAFVMAFTACEKDDPDGPVGADGYDNFYYAGFLPWNNTATESVFRTQTTLVKFPVQFHSAFVRNYDAAAHFTLVTTGIANPAVLGQDFNVVDKSGNAIQATNGIYSLNFSQAKAKIDTIYFKVLNSAVVGTRRIEINLVQHNNAQYTVGTFTQAYKRFLEVK
ncbi:hypothetical protein [Pedobacter xixiisoli]|uniref:DUF4843 domain-containing protein n=1 Tax=Pedobacter xixiisoli TaxID=1476464 RepID=A0A285ZRW3_9SPHI|nr:hypothetical protein [Pedobacter xixiisoli]SOD12357.1 hypothetical protein SAMN06297358_0624 [Pedobacter xixiisoli]